MRYARAAFFAVLVALGARQTQVRAAGMETRRGLPFTARLSVRSATVDPSDGVNFHYQFNNVTKGTIACDRPAALNGFHFVFSPVDRSGKRTVCPGPFRQRLDPRRPLTALVPGDGISIYSKLNFPRDLLPGQSMNRDYPTPPPGLYDLTAVLIFPKSPEGWSGAIITPPLRVTVALSKKRKADLAASRPFSPEERRVLDATEKRLRQAVHGLLPRVTVRLEGHILTAEQRTRTFMVYAVQKTGEIARTPDSTLGPEHDGFLLKTWVGEAGARAADGGPQDLRKPYWTTHLNAYPLSETTVLSLSLSYGSHADRAVIAKLKEAVAGAAR